jgi:hypothetical protein
MNDEPSPPEGHPIEMASSGLDAPRDEALLAMFLERNGSPSRVVPREGTILTVFNIAWGYDVGDEYSHVTSNVSPAVKGSGSICSSPTTWTTYLIK